MDFVAVCISILLWLVRPQDWVSGLSGIGFMTYSMLAAIFGLYRRSEGLKLKDFIRSPADYLVIGYLAWIIWTTGNWFDMAKAMFPFAAFYFVTALALTTPRRLTRFLSCWIAGLSITTALTLCTVYGFEIVAGSATLTTQFGERLALNTWIYNNPNSLGHGIVALIPAAYIWLVWRRSGALKLLGFAIIAGAAQVTYLTQSKGAYLCGAAAVMACLLFRRSRIVQIFLLACMLTAGLGALKMLPRMETMDDKEAGIAGRLLIWQMAYNAMQNTKTGEGWKKFEAWIDTEDYGLIRKATHGSYVNVGADLGYIGLLLFVGILYANGRTLMMARVNPDEVDMERCQRLLLSLTASFVASAWMIDRAYHTDYFILAGAVAAFHRLLTLESASINEAEENVEVESLSLSNALIPEQGMISAATLAGGMTISKTALSTGSSESFSQSGNSYGLNENDSEDQSFIGLAWYRLQWVDAAWIICIFFAVITIWQKLMTSFISF